MRSTLASLLRHAAAPVRKSAYLVGSTLALAGCLDRPVAPARPTTTNTSINVLPTRDIDKIDLLFMIDNSISMVDKQRILETAVPVLLRRLVTPNCLDEMGAPVGTADANGRCTTGKAEFRAIRDIHVGVITSSLGNHGGDECTEDATTMLERRTPDDRAELLPTANPAVRGPLASWNQSGFLAWDPGQDKNSPPGEANLDVLVRDFASHVVAAGDRGCGYESSLEAWYRFLVDPEPPASMTTTTVDGFESTRKGPVNQTVLAQRRAFLRPDSLLAIVMLTDENDCSILDEDGTQGHYVTLKARLPRASSACATNPNDPCCHSCGGSAPAGCPPTSEDPACARPIAPDRSDDQPNLRCFAQKQRFGIDFLYPIERYVDGLTKTTVRNRAGVEVTNPIFEAPPGMPPRDPKLVLLAGIVGVPWQDIASRESWTGDGLEYLTAKELEEQGRWPLMLGDVDGSPPTDPFMRESVEPRTGTHPLLPIATVAPGAGEKNPINGSEQLVPHVNDLQYACTFPLEVPRPCDAGSANRCDCNADESDSQRSICDYPNGPTQDGREIAGKAYPGTRTLAVLRGLEENAIVASICPKYPTPRLGVAPASDPTYGYNPAIAALLDIMVERIPRQCLPRPLPIEDDPTSADFGKVPCAVVEALPRRDTCGCDPSRGRLPIDAGDGDLREAVFESLRANQSCDAPGARACGELCLCKIPSLEGAELAACQDGANDPDAFGYCYVDPDRGIGAEALVEGCRATERRILRFSGQGLPANGAITFMACQGATLSDASATSSPEIDDPR